MSLKLIILFYITCVLLFLVWKRRRRESTSKIEAWRKDVLSTTHFPHKQLFW